MLASKPGKIAVLVAVVMGVFLMQVTAGFLNPSAAIASATLLSIAVLLISPKSDAILRAFFAAGMIACLSAALVVSLSDEGSDPILNALAPAAFALVATIELGIRGHKVKRPTCFRCRQKIEGVPAQCPCCERSFCDSELCWNSLACRCSDCEAAGIRVLPSESAWWNNVFGAPLAQRSTCAFCQDDASELYGCGDCGLPYCQQCWDHHLGQCRKCKWAASGLPKSVTLFHYRRKPI